MITLKQLFTLPEFETIHVVAGKSGINRPVTGVNVMESAHLAEFFKKYELLITTGINMKGDTGQLIALVETAWQRGAAGIVLNVGPYIPSIPDQVIRFADEHYFPVYEMPWIYRVADFVKISIQYIALTGKKQSKSENLFAKILFNTEDTDKHMAENLLKAGIQSHTHYAVIVCLFNHIRNVPAWAAFAMEDELLKRFQIRLSMSYRNQAIFMVERKENEIDRQFFISLKQNMLRNRTAEKMELHIGAGNEYPVHQLSKSYREALSVIRLTGRHPALPFYQYKDIGAYRVLFELSDKEVSQSFSRDMLGALYRYDRLHQADLVHFLRVFLDEDGHTTEIARKEFIHRNTVLYKIKKIQSILDMDLTNPYVKTNLLLAFMIEDIED